MNPIRTRQLDDGRDLARTGQFFFLRVADTSGNFHGFAGHFSSQIEDQQSFFFSPFPAVPVHPLMPFGNIAEHVAMFRCELTRQSVSEFATVGARDRDACSKSVAPNSRGMPPFVCMAASLIEPPANG